MGMNDDIKACVQDWTEYIASTYLYTFWSSTPSKYFLLYNSTKNNPEQLYLNFESELST